VTRVELDLAAAARSERIELREAPAGDVDITEADFLLAIGRGAGTAENVARLERLAELLGATLAVSGPLVEAGLAARTRKVGQSGKTVAPHVYLALGISGAAQHLGGMSRSRTIIAVNSDPGARIFDVAHYGAVADLFEVADELERQLARARRPAGGGRRPADQGRGVGGVLRPRATEDAAPRSVDGSLRRPSAVGIRVPRRAGPAPRSRDRCAAGRRGS
jgi:hypothetical protein